MTPIQSHRSNLALIRVPACILSLFKQSDQKKEFLKDHPPNKGIVQRLVPIFLFVEPDGLSLSFPFRPLCQPDTTRRTHHPALVSRLSLSVHTNAPAKANELPAS